VTGTITPGTSLLDTYWYKIPAGVPKDIAGGVDLEPEDMTLVRTLPNIQVHMQQDTAGPVMAHVAAGLIVWEGISQDDPSVLTVPFPVEDGDADWIWHFASVGGNAVSAATSFLADNGQNSFDRQSKAQRKLSARQGILFVVEVSNVLGEHNLSSFVWSFYGRSLFKLP
jgi:hypothetical protein